MHSKLFWKLHEAIDKAIEELADEDLWEYYIHESLSREMATAAAQVFDASMNGQAFQKREVL